MCTNISRTLFFWLAALILLSGLAACGGSSVNAAQPQAVATINPAFQSYITPIPTVPPYRCGAWSSNNAPGPDSTIQIYARLTTHDASGASGMTATATVHFQYGDLGLGQATSDAGGYVSFTLALRGQQPAKVPATVDVTFSGLPHGGPVQCSQAFFTPV